MRIISVVLIVMTTASCSCGPIVVDVSQPSPTRTPDQPIYEMLDYTALSAVLFGPLDAPDDSAAMLFLDSRKETFDGHFSSLAITYWLQASTRACGDAMSTRGRDGQSEYYELFPQGPTNVDKLWLTFLSRKPSDSERLIMRELRHNLGATWENRGFPETYDGDVYRSHRMAAAECAAVLNTLEFLSVN